MSDTAIDRTITINRDEDVCHPLSATVTDAPGSMPVVLTSGHPDRDVVRIFMTWQEWAEVRDHVEYCSTMKMKDEAEDVYEVCGAMPGLVPYTALPCILQNGHGDTTPHHMDRLGRAW